jgi:hypothetical protein
MGPYWRCPCVREQELAQGIPTSLLVKNLVYQQRLVETFRHRGERRPLARC